MKTMRVKVKKWIERRGIGNYRSQIMDMLAVSWWVVERPATDSYSPSRALN